jgi:hypothetical protein
MVHEGGNDGEEKIKDAVKGLTHQAEMDVMPGLTGRTLQPESRRSRWVALYIC